MKKIVLFFSFLVFSAAHAQEIICSVTLNSDQLYAQQTTDANAITQLKGAITDFMNSKRWTNDNFSTEEKVNCKLNINLLRSPSQGVYEGNAQFIVTRPVYGSTYETVTLSFVDRAFNFSYLPSNPMYFNENSFSDDLTQMLAFYALVALATDYDTFAKSGGSLFVQRAYNLANIAQNASGGAGWKSSDTRSRYWLVENLMNLQFSGYRDALYTYHRLGLDTFGENPVIARKKIIESLNAIKQVNQLKPGAVLINSFFDAKGDELYKILREATRDERQKAYQTLSQIDPAKTDLYKKLLQ